MTTTRWRCQGSLGFTLALAFTAGCESAPEAPLEPATPVAEFVAAESGQQAYLQEVTQIIAMALGDQGLRSRLISDMRRSEYTEHKLPFEQYLRGNSGGILLAKMDAYSSRSRAEILDLLRFLPPLEIYMPVPVHRESWQGTSDVLVSAQRIDSREEETATRIAYDVQGQAIPLLATVAPTQPTIVIGPAEADFTRTIDPARYRNVNDNGGRSVGTYRLRDDVAPTAICNPEVTDCYGGGGGGGGGGGYVPPTDSDTVHIRGVGVREIIEYMWTPNDHEPWDLGAPEFDLFFAANSDSDGSSELKHKIRVPEEPWSGSDDDNNSRPRYFGGEGMMVADWDTDYGNRLLIECREDDYDLWEQASVVLKGSTVFLGLNLEVAFEAKWADIVGGYDDNCGEGNILLRTSGNVWTPIFHSSQDYRYYYHGFVNGPRWNGFGLDYIYY